MKVIYKGKVYELQGQDAWTEPRFKVLREMNPKGKVCVIETDGNRDKFLVAIGELELKPEPLN